MENKSDQTAADFEKMLDPLVDSQMSEFIPTPLESIEQHRKRLKAQLLKSHRDYQQLYVNAGKALVEGGFVPEALDAKKIQAIQSNVDDIVKKMIETDGPIAELFGLTDNDLLKMYEIGCQFFDENNLTKARDIFSLLTILDSDQFAFWSALGIVEQALNDFDIAAMAHTMAAELDPGDPGHYLYVANCLYHQDKKTEALQLVNLLIEGVSDRPEWELVKSQAEEVKMEWTKAA